MNTCCGDTDREVFSKMGENTASSLDPHVDHSIWQVRGLMVASMSSSLVRSLLSSCLFFWSRRCCV